MRFHSRDHYGDDLLIFSSDWNSHLQQLDLTFTTFKVMNISVSTSKTEIGASEINVLGYKLSGDSVRMTDKMAWHVVSD